MFFVRTATLSLAMLALMASTAPQTYAQVNNNNALMQRLDNIERDLGLMQRQVSNAPRANINRPSTDADAGPIMGNVNGDLLQQVTMLEEEIRRLRGQIEKNDYEIERMQDQQKRTLDDMDFRLRALEGTGMPGVPSMSDTPAPSGSHIEVHGAGSATLPTSEESKATTAGDGVLTKTGSKPRKLYNEAFRLLNQNRYEDSEKLFDGFTETYPKDPLIGNAYYWLGETHYIRKDYIKAADKFREGYQKLPDGPKAPDNLLKLAMSLKAMDRTEDACTVLGQVEKKFKDASKSILQRAKSEKKLMGCE